jgi:hypothetical protein
MKLIEINRFKIEDSEELGKPVLKALTRLIDCHLVKTDKPGSNK